MSAISNGKSLSMHNDAIWKGTFTHNGTLLKIHENDFTIGYSALLAPDGATTSTVKFGDGVFYNAVEKNNKVYVGAPTADGAEAVFAGIVVREPAIASGYPALNDEVSSFQKGLLVKEGYVVYKKATVGSEVVELYDSTSIKLGVNMYVASSDGAVYFGTAKTTESDVLAGKIVEINPDDKSVTVYIAPAFYMA
jgi:hypothetical protein